MGRGARGSSARAAPSTGDRHTPRQESRRAPVAQARGGELVHDPRPSPAAEAASRPSALGADSVDRDGGGAAGSVDSEPVVGAGGPVAGRLGQVQERIEHLTTRLDNFVKPGSDPVFDELSPWEQRDLMGQVLAELEAREAELAGLDAAAPAPSDQLAADPGYDELFASGSGDAKPDARSSGSETSVGAEPPAAARQTGGQGPGGLSSPTANPAAEEAVEAPGWMPGPGDGAGGPAPGPDGVEREYDPGTEPDRVAVQDDAETMEVFDEALRQQRALGTEPKRFDSPIYDRLFDEYVPEAEPEGPEPASRQAGVTDRTRDEPAGREADGQGRVGYPTGGPSEFANLGFDGSIDRSGAAEQTGVAPQRRAEAEEGQSAGGALGEDEKPIAERPVGDRNPVVGADVSGAGHVEAVQEQITQLMTDMDDFERGRPAGSANTAPEFQERLDRLREDLARFSEPGFGEPADRSAPREQRDVRSPGPAAVGPADQGVGSGVREEPGVEQPPRDPGPVVEGAASQEHAAPSLADVAGLVEQVQHVIGELSEDLANFEQPEGDAFFDGLDEQEKAELKADTAAALAGYEADLARLETDIRDRIGRVEADLRALGPDEPANGLSLQERAVVGRRLADERDGYHAVLDSLGPRAGDSGREPGGAPGQTADGPEAPGAEAETGGAAAAAGESDRVPEPDGGPVEPADTAASIDAPAPAEPGVRPGAGAEAGADPTASESGWVPHVPTAVHGTSAGSDGTADPRPESPPWAAGLGRIGRRRTSELGPGQAVQSQGVPGVGGGRGVPASAAQQDKGSQALGQGE